AELPVAHQRGHPLGALRVRLQHEIIPSHSYKAVLELIERLHHDAAVNGTVMRCRAHIADGFPKGIDRTSWLDRCNPSNRHPILQQTKLLKYVVITSPYLSLPLTRRLCRQLNT